MQCYVEQKIKHPGSTVWALSVCLFLKVGHHLQLFLAVETEILLASGRNAKRDVHRYIWSRSHVSILSLDKTYNPFGTLSAVLGNTVPITFLAS